MRLPTGGQIVVVDDNYDEAKPILDQFGKLGISSLYYKGDLTGLPEKPIESVRLLFLDINLKGAPADPKSKASVIAGVLQKIISPSNGPYFIIFWSRHPEVIKLIVENCKSQNISPVNWVDLDKSALLKTDNTYDLEEVRDKMNEKLLETGAFQLFVEWEIILRSAGVQFINEFSKLVPFGPNWSSDTSAIFNKLYKSYTDEMPMSDEDKFKCACFLMNRSFQDKLLRLTKSELRLPEGFTLAADNVSSTIVAKLNKWLFFGDGPVDIISAGQIYLHTDDKLKASLITLFKQSVTPTNVRLCKVVITPECDIAQNKMLPFGVANAEGVITSHDLHRVVYGLLFDSNVDPKNLLKRETQAQVWVGPMWHEDRHQGLLLHLATIGFEHSGNLVGPPIMSLSRDLLFDFQTKAANHVNRLGNFIIS